MLENVTKRKEFHEEGKNNNNNKYFMHSANEALKSDGE